MIIYELTRLYNSLLEKGVIPPAPWADEGVSYGVWVEDDGDIYQITNLRNEGKRPAIMRVPEHEDRTVATIPFYLRDKADYLLGIGPEGAEKRTKERFEKSKEMHLKNLDGVNSKAAAAVRNFFNNWVIKDAENKDTFKDYLDDLKAGAFVMFYYGGNPVTEDVPISEAWIKQNLPNETDKRDICLITGKRDKIARLHPTIKGVVGTPTSGALLVSYNADAFESYGNKQGDNAHIGETASKAYGAALKYLLADRDRKYVIENLTVTGWALDGNKTPSDFFFGELSGDALGDEDVKAAVKTLASGKPLDWNGEIIDPEQPFFVLGMTPNMSRIAVNFFLRNTFGGWLKNIRAHAERLEITKYEKLEYKDLPIWKILREIKPPGDKAKVTPLANSLLQAVLNNTRYPEELLYATLRRIRADNSIGWERAAILKAYLLKNSNKENLKGGCTLSLNEEFENKAYLLGRLFAILERIQKKSAGDINTTIKDQYLSAMCSTPSLVLARLLKLEQSHMKKLKRDHPGMAVNLDKELIAIMGKLEAPIPRQLNAEEQAVFMLGYYHQTQNFYEKHGTNKPEEDIEVEGQIIEVVEE